MVDFDSMLPQALSGEAAIEDPEQSRILDAARAEFVAHGFRRAAVADIARRAKVSRQTLHRRCGDKDAIISAVIVREVLQFFFEIESGVSAELTTEERSVELFVTGMRACQQNPIVAAIKEYEPERFSFHSFGEEPEGYPVIRTLLALQIAPGRMQAAERAVELIIRITATLLLSPTAIFPMDTDDDTRAFARTYFLPIIAATFQVDDEENA
ncbi:MAG: TetR/AcrR family transcriptional regulator [Segniliparus sp.]|uniref:TetR/AcrR family transcriptional regulator n=1 Tax=Segniliparus sp. TaxID=2804064 RepID=UPI003F2BB4D5